ncbi:FAD-binding protein [Breoghania sp. L-A4]|uniref:FAD-binding protein n=1 Tax=Breoghania sp. L-A4 TaxID=2304600 RepID=UPI000E3582CB|nr:FAD-binding protein [Breoghania sp. L-A4]AXS42015.1 FAD-binding oxidoreductase [Breoghania sp. L-A4]
MSGQIESWGRVRRYDHDVRVLSTYELDETLLPAISGSGKSLLAHGMGRSYGDVALNQNNHLLLTKQLDFLIDADWNTGRIVAGTGLTLKALHALSVPRGWISAVVPGTAFASLGGCVANDVHGKNHPDAGSFGAHVIRLQLRRSSGEALVCDRDKNRQLFALTLGGLGLTGLIEWVELQLAPCASPLMEEERLAVTALPELFSLFRDSPGWPHKVAWIDGLVDAMPGFRGVFSRARPTSPAQPGASSPSRPVLAPAGTPGGLINRFSLSAFNRLQFHLAQRGPRSVRPYQDILHPLDRVTHWNRLYGRCGFFQYQALVPAEDAVADLLNLVFAGTQRPTLAVLKLHGETGSPGLMSFCREGASLALDFANRGPGTLRLLDALDAIVLRHGGRVYPAKDGRMPARAFQRFFPRWVELQAGRDPAFSSSFWRRVAGNAGALR